MSARRWSETSLFVFLDLVITLGLAGTGFLLGFVLVLIGLPEWLLWFTPLWFGNCIPFYRLVLCGGYR